MFYILLYGNISSTIPPLLRSSLPRQLVEYLQPRWLFRLAILQQMRQGSHLPSWDPVALSRCHPQLIRLHATPAPYFVCSQKSNYKFVESSGIPSAAHARRPNVICMNGNLWFETYDLKPMIQNLRFDTYDSKPTIQNLWFKTCDSKPAIQNLLFKTCNLNPITLYSPLFETYFLKPMIQSLIFENLWFGTYNFETYIKFETCYLKPR